MYEQFVTRYCEEELDLEEDWSKSRVLGSGEKECQSSETTFFLSG